MWEIVLIRGVDQVDYEKRLYSQLCQLINVTDGSSEETLNRDQRNKYNEKRMRLLERIDPEAAYQLRRHVQSCDAPVNDDTSTVLTGTDSRASNHDLPSQTLNRSSVSRFSLIEMKVKRNCKK